jgi:predicted TIM-barrel fold metal-dependent hydrolase
MNREHPPEEVREPDLRIVDPHHHLWSYPARGGFQPVYLLEELRADTGSGHRIDKTVFVECSYGYRTDGPPELVEVGETEFVAGVAEASAGDGGGARIAGIVAACDLSLGERLGAVLDAHEAAGRGRFRGIRHRLAHDPTGSARTSRKEPNEPDLMTTEEFRAGVALLGARGLTFDAWLYHVQLPQLIAMAAAVPDTTIILDHIGAPLAVGAYEDKRAAVHAEWREHLTELATRPNVVVKLGGVGMVPYGSGWSERQRPASSDEIVDEWGEALLFIIATFGARRCMFESNFPVDKVSFSYRTMWNAYKKLTAGLPAADRSELFAGTAERVYRV